jgi:hypothetical protein
MSKRALLYKQLLLLHSPVVSDFLARGLRASRLTLESVLQGTGRDGYRGVGWAPKRQRLVDRWKGVRIIKIARLREVKAKLSKILKELPSKNPS